MSFFETPEHAYRRLVVRTTTGAEAHFNVGGQSWVPGLGEFAEVLEGAGWVPYKPTPRDILDGMYDALGFWAGGVCAGAGGRTCST